MSTSMPPRFAARIRLLLIVAGAYVATGWIGLQIPAYGSSITLLWLPTGIAVAALLRWGTWCWPGIALAAFALNSMVGSPWPVALAIAFGNTFGPWVTTWIARRAGMRFALERPRDILALSGAAVLGMLVSSAIGIAALASGGLLPNDRLAPWLLWWAGDALGVVIGAPLILASSRAQWRAILHRIGEFLTWAFLGGIIGWGVFVFNQGPAGHGWALAFLLLPSVAWAALRFGVVGTSLALILVSFSGAYGTAFGSGPFQSDQPLASALLLWVYMATAAVVGWLISALRVARSASEDAQREQQAELLRFKSVLDQTVDCVFIFRTDNLHFVYANEGAKRQIGYTKEELLGMTPMDIKPQVTAEQFRQLTQPLRDGAQRAATLETVHRHKDGHLIPVEVVLQLVHSQDGETRFVAISRDISERKHAELLRATEREVLELLSRGAPLNDVLGCLALGCEAIFPGMLCSVLLLDTEGRRLRRGAAPSLPESYCSAIDGMEIGPAAGSCGTAAHTRQITVCSDISTDPLWRDFRELALAAGLRACWSVPVISSQDRVLGAFALYYTEVRAPSPDEIAAIERGAHIVRLAVERHELLGALKESQLRLATLVENLPGMAYRCRNDDDWTMTYVSDGCLAITGYRADEMQDNRAVAFGSLVHPDDRDWLWTKCQTSLEAHTPCQNEYRIIDRHGRERWVSDRASGSYDAEGKLRFIDGFIQDVTDIRRARIEAERLAHRMREKQRLESVGTLAGGIAHEFNNLITVMLGHTELALRAADVGPAAADSLGTIRKAGQQARHIVQQILTFSRQQPGDRQVTALAPVVEEAIGLLRTTLTSTVQLDCQCAPNTPNVLADPMQLQQVIVNLCINAVQAMAGRPGSISVRAAAITLPAPEGASPDLAPGEYALVSVSDQGAGMDAATVARIFEPFFTTKPVGEGTGLGLSVVHGIVHAHGGAITVHSKPGKGSRFEVYLPATQQRAAAPAISSAPPVDAPGRKAHILFVDDQAWLLPLAQRMLEDEGYRVSTFADARAAIDHLGTDPVQFDLVVTDFKMPGMSGVEVAREVRALRADLPIILMSGAVMDGLDNESVAAGVTAFIYKPAIAEELGPAIRKLLS